MKELIGNKYWFIIFILFSIYNSCFTYSDGVFAFIDSSITYRVIHFFSSLIIILSLNFYIKYIFDKFIYSNSQDEEE